MTQINPFDNVSPVDYASCSIVAQTMAHELLQRLELVAMQPKIIVDAGCGLGDITCLLQRKYPTAAITAFDSATHFLEHAKNQHASPAIHWLLSNANRLPIDDHSVDLLFANLLLPWCHDSKALLAEWRRILHPEGLLVFTTLGPDTLRQLPPSIEQLISLTDMHLLGDALIQAGFSDPIMDVDTLTLKYRDPAKLLHELTAMGLINAGHQPESLTEPSITFELIYGHAWGPKYTRTAKINDNGEVNFPLSYLRG